MPSATESKKTIRPATGTQRVLSDALSATRRPDGYGVMLIDLQAAEAFRRERTRQTGVPLTMLDLYLRAGGLTLRRDLWLNAHAHGYKVSEYEQIDIGVSVTSTTLVAPVVVVRDADNKSLEEIHHERTRLVEEANKGNEARQADLEKWARLLPVSWLRRRLVQWAINQPRFRHQNIGTAQITTIDLPDMDFYLPAHIATSLLMSVGGVKSRPMVVNGQVEARLSAYCAYMIDQRVVHPVRAMKTFRRFRRYLEDPEKLA